MSFFWNKNKSDTLTSDDQLDGPEKTEKKLTTYLRIGVLMILLTVFALIAFAVAIYFINRLFADVSFGTTVINKLLDAIPTLLSVGLLMFGFKGVLRNK